jgi:hypothetical protein
MVTEAILSSLPTFYLCTLKLVNGAIEVVDKTRGIGVWGKLDIQQAQIFGGLGPSLQT